MNEKKRQKAEYVPKGVKIGRNYDDFNTFMGEAGVSEHQKFDTVIGNIGR